LTLSNDKYGWAPVAQSYSATFCKGCTNGSSAVASQPPSKQSRRIVDYQGSFKVEPPTPSTITTSNKTNVRWTHAKSFKRFGQMRNQRSNIILCEQVEPLIFFQLGKVAIFETHWDQKWYSGCKVVLDFYTP